MILCNCCNTDNAPMARHKDYWICDDCVQKYGSYDAAVEAIKERKNSEDKIVYLCDKKKHCKYSPSCGNECNHTLDPKHALNGVCDNPDDSERFKWEFNSWIEQEEKK